VAAAAPSGAAWGRGWVAGDGDEARVLDPVGWGHAAPPPASARAPRRWRRKRLRTPSTRAPTSWFYRRAHRGFNSPRCSAPAPSFRLRRVARPTHSRVAQVGWVVANFAIAAARKVGTPSTRTCSLARQIASKASCGQKLTIIFFQVIYNHNI